MSRRVAEFDDDDLDYDEGYEEAEEEELSAEDKAAMDQAKAKVSAALGAEYRKLASKDIEDTLWHYYYDVEKSVAYLRKTYLSAPAPKAAPKAAPKKAPEGTSRKLSFFVCTRRLGEGSGADEESSAGDACIGYMDDTESTSMLPTTSFPFGHTHGSFFSDMPWLNVPQHRKTTFLKPPRPRGGLLGGGDSAPKMSKLQALAAARKKKTEGLKESAKTTTSSTENDMKRLSLSDQKKENERPGLALAKRQKTSDTRVPLIDQMPVPVADPSVPGDDAPAQHGSAENVDETMRDQHDQERVPLDQAVMATPNAPSAFARTLFGPAPETPKPERDVFAMPYTSSSAYFAGAFTKPSPDDIVLTAQAKGSNFTKTK